MTTRKPPPRDLGTRGRAFWRRTVADYDLSDTEQELLRESCRLMDECESLRASVDEQGTTVLGSAGQVVVHPAVAQLRQHRLALGKLLSQLALPDLDGASLPSPMQARGKKAAQARWGVSNG